MSDQASSVPGGRPVPTPGPTPGPVTTPGPVPTPRPGPVPAPNPGPTPGPRPGPAQTADQRSEAELSSALAAVRDLPTLDAVSTTPEQMQARIEALSNAHDTLRGQLSTLGR
ncbi:hypothetical protein [Calidifontibacter terrae]